MAMAGDFEKVLSKPYKALAVIAMTVIDQCLFLPGDLNIPCLHSFQEGEWLQQFQSGKSHSWHALKIGLSWHCNVFCFFHLYILPKSIQYPVYLGAKNLCVCFQCHLLVSSKLHCTEIYSVLNLYFEMEP